MKTRNAKLLVLSCAALIAAAGTAAVAQTTATWTGLGGDTDYMNPLNWNPSGTVPINGSGITYTVIIPSGATVTLDILTPANIDVQNLILGSGARIITRPGRTLNVVQDSDIRGSVDARLGGSFISAGGSSLITGNSSSMPTFLAANGGLIRLNAPAYSMSPIRYGNIWAFSADTGATIDASSLRTFDAGWNDADGNQNVTTVNASNNGVVNLSGVQALNTPGRTEDRIDFVMSGGGTVNLSGLQQITGNGTARFVVPDTASYTLNSLATAANMRIDAGSSATVDLPLLTAVNGTMNVYAAAHGTVNAPSLATIDNSRWVSWSRSSDDYYQDYDYQARIGLAEGAQFNAPQLTALNWVQIDQYTGSVFNAPNLDRMNFSHLYVQPGRTLTTGAMHNIDNTKIIVSGGAQFGVSTGNLGAVAYSMTGYRYGWGTVFSADGAGSVLDLSSVRTFDAGWNDRDGNQNVTTVNASNNGVVNLSGVQALNTPGRTEDRIDFVMPGGGTVSLSGLQQITGNGTARFVVPDTASYTLNSLATAANMRIDAGASATVSLPLLTAVNGTMNVYAAAHGTVNAPSLSTIDNSRWVTANRSSDDYYMDYDYQARVGLADGAQFNAPQLTSLNWVQIDQFTGSVFNAPNLDRMNFSRLYIQPGKTLTTGAMHNIDNTKIIVSGGAQFGVSTGNLGAVAYSMTGYRYGWGTVFSADGAGSVLDLSSVRTFDAGWNDRDGNQNVTTVNASNNGVVNLSGVQALNTPGRTEDRIDFVMPGGGTVSLSGLQQITGNGTARFVVPDTASYTLNSLATAANMRIDAGASATVSLPLLTAVNGTMNVYAAAHGTVNAPSLSTIDNSRWVTANRSSDDYYMDYDYQARVGLADGAQFNAPQLTSLNWVQIDQFTGSVFNAPNLDRMNFSRLYIQPGKTLTTGAMHNIDNTKIIVSGGAQFGVSTGNLGAVAYSMTGYRYGWGTVFSADGAGSVLDLSSVRTFDAGWNDRDGNQNVTTVNASNNGVVNLSGVQALNTPGRTEDRIDFVASSSGRIDLRGIRSINGGGQARFTAYGGGAIQFGDLTVGNNVQVNLQDPGSTFSVERSLSVNSGSISVAAGALVSIGKHLSYRLTAETAFNFSTGILEFSAPGTHFLEIGGLDLGPTSPGNDGNFGIGRIVVGAANQASTLQILDLIDNGNRGGTINEALYLYGIGQATNEDSLVLLGGSTLYIDNLNVYARENGNWIWLNSLFGAGQTVIPYSGGYLHLPSPGSVAPLALAFMLAGRRRRGC